MLEYKQEYGKSSIKFKKRRQFTVTQSTDLSLFGKKSQATVWKANQYYIMNMSNVSREDWL